MNQPRSHELDGCGCCTGITGETPVEIENRPGLPAIAYRVGTYRQFKASMLASLSDPDPKLVALQSLTTREDDDLTIGLIDAWAVVADVLTFYQERIANESYVRTATEAGSLLHLARLIGYELRPGVAASTYLAFTLESAQGAPGHATIPIGTKVQSVPGPGETPQTFETIEQIQAVAQWNAMKPRTQWPQRLLTTMPRLLLKGTTANLKQGDSVLIVTSTVSGTLTTAGRLVTNVVLDNTHQQTRVDLDDASGAAATPANPSPLVAVTDASATYAVPAALVSQSLPLNDTTIEQVIAGHLWRQSDLQAVAIAGGWTIEDLFTNVSARQARISTSQPAATGAFALRARASLFGYNAPDWKAMSKDVRTTYGKAEGISNADDVTLQQDWPLGGYPSATNQLDLDIVYSKILPKTWAVVTRPVAANSPSLNVIAQIDTVTETALANFTLSSKVTELRLALDDTAPLPDVAPGSMGELRRTTVRAQSEQLDLAWLPYPTDQPPGAGEAQAPPVENDVIELDQLYSGLNVGQPIAISGERHDLAGVQASEVTFLKDVLHCIEGPPDPNLQPADTLGGRTILVLTANLTHPYRRDTTTINANLAFATHGETVREVLGSGDASVPYQRFTLLQAPLTYVHAPNSSGATSTLHVYVDDLEWAEVANFNKCGPRDHVYTTRLRDDGKTTVQFSDGEKGARLPTGHENVRATYRKGVGHEGLVKAGQLTLLMARPFGVKSVTNPQDSAGAEDPEGLDAGRGNAALTMQTMNRVVSLQDYEDVASAYSGVAKALATLTWDGQSRSVFLTVAGPNGVEIGAGPARSLGLALQRMGDPYVVPRVQSYAKLLFEVGAKVQVDPAYEAADVLTSVEHALRSHFSFDARSFGQPVVLSEVNAVMQSVPGVLGVVVDALYLKGDPETLRLLIPAPPPQPDADPPRPAALLTLDPGPLAHLELLP